MKIQIVAALIGALVASAGGQLTSPLSDEQQQCVNSYLLAVEQVVIPGDVQEFVDSHQRGEAPAGCEHLNEANEKLYSEVPCARNFRYDDLALRYALRSSELVGRLFQTTAACAMAQAGFLRQ